MTIRKTLSPHPFYTNPQQDKIYSLHSWPPLAVYICSLTVNCYTVCRGSCTNTSSLQLSPSLLSPLSSSLKSSLLSRQKVNFLPGGLQKDVLLPAHTDISTLTSVQSISHPENKRFCFLPPLFGLLCSSALCVDRGWPYTQKEKKNDKGKGIRWGEKVLTRSTRWTGPLIDHSFRKERRSLGGGMGGRGGEG